MPVLIGRSLAALAALGGAFSLGGAPAKAPPAPGDRTPLAFTAPGAWPDTQLTLRRAGDTVQLVEAGGRVLRSRAAGSISEIVVSGARHRNDTLTVDLSRGPIFVPGGIRFDGGRGGFDTLKVIGDRTNRGSYLPSKTTYGDGRVTVDGLTIDFTGLEPVEVSEMETFTFTTPGATDILTVDSVEVGKAQVSGTSDGVAFETLTWFNVTQFTLDAGASEGSGPSDVGRGSDSVQSSGDDAYTIVGRVLRLLADDEHRNKQLRSLFGSGTLTVDVEVPAVTPETADGLHIESGADTETITVRSEGSVTLADHGISCGTPLTRIITFAECAGSNATVIGSDNADMLDCSGWTGRARIEGLGGNDTCIGGPNRDFFIPGLGDDSCDGGGVPTGQRDSVSQSGAGNVLVTASAFSGPEGTDTLSEIQSVSVNLAPGDWLLNYLQWTGTTTTVLTDGSSTVYGGPDRDSLNNGTSACTFYGNDGSDIVSPSNLTDKDASLTCYLGGGNDFFSGGAGNDRCNGGSGNDSLSGNDGNDRLSGDAGNDTVRGGNGNDILAGGSGDDQVQGDGDIDALDGGEGNDTCIGGSGDDNFWFGSASVTQTDTCVESDGGGIDRLNFGTLPASDPVTVNLSSTTLASHANRTVICTSGQQENFECASGGAGNDSLTGNSRPNSLAGFNGSDSLYGLSGNDYLLGLNGDDTMDGGANFDRCDGGDGDDTAVNCESTTNVP